MPESSSEDGNDSSPDSPLSPPVPPVGGFREETISKEKQKFFRSNSFYGIKGRGPSRCKVEGRPVRDISCSSSSSESSVENDVAKKSPIQAALRNAVVIDGKTKPPLTNGERVSPDKKKLAAKERDAPFSAFGASVQCVTFEDLAKKCKTDDTVEPLLPKPNANWLQKPKTSEPKKDNFGRIFSGSNGCPKNAEQPRPAADDISIVTGKNREPSSSDSWHHIIKPSSSILSQKSHASKSEPLPQSEQSNEELWGFAAAAARKPVTPVLHLDKKGAPSFTSSVILSDKWNTRMLKTDDKPNDGPAADKSEVDESKHDDEPALTLSPSKLVKSAVISKQYEHVRRNMLASNTPFLYVNQSGDVVPSDKETIKKNLIAEATKTQHFQVCRHLNHLSVQSVSVPPSRPCNRSGKRITSYLNSIPFEFPDTYQNFVANSFNTAAA